LSEAANPYAPPKAVVEVAVEAPPIELASRAARFGAAVVDSLILFGALLFGGIIHPAAAVVGVLAVGGLNLWTLHRHRASLGKCSLGLRIVRSDGSEAEFWRIVLLRSLPVTVIGAIPYLGLLTVVDALFIFGSARRCVHDYAADTVVVDGK
jgi:uncharacterized RDD family membrane protein YckC